MLNRRHLFGALPLAAASTATAVAQTTERSQDGVQTENLYDWGFLGPDHDFGAGISSGTKRGREIARAIDVLRDIPKTADHLGVATYFSTINIANESCQSFAQEWQTKKTGPSNPLITMFHLLTNTMPNPQDNVPWCAAFVSFCLRAGGKESLWSYRALDYADYPGLDVTAAPRAGDIVVFRNTKGGGGHVTLFIAWDLDRRGRRVGLRCLGGNQGDRVKISTYPLDASRTLEAIRRPIAAKPLVEKAACTRG